MNVDPTGDIKPDRCAFFPAAGKLPPPTDEKKPTRVVSPGGIPLFPLANPKKHPRLFLPKYLAEEADHLSIDPAELERATALLSRWADAAADGHLKQKETSLDAEFLQKIFGEALNYKSVTESPHDYHREKNPSVAGAGIADGALGLFISGKAVPPLVIIELKGASTDLDHDKFSGRTPVQQCWSKIWKTSFFPAAARLEFNRASAVCVKRKRRLGGVLEVFHRKSA